MEALVAEYEDTKPCVLEDATTDPMNPQLAATLETWLWCRYNSDEIKKTQEKAHRPGNANALIPLKIDEEVFHALNPECRTVDTCYRFIQNAMIKGCQPIANVIITAITHLHHYRGTDNPFLQITPEHSIDIMQIKAELDLGLRLLGMANCQLGLRRRLTMRPHLAPRFHHLCAEHHQINQWMFGGNIKATIDDVCQGQRRPFFRQVGLRSVPVSWQLLQRWRSWRQTWGPTRLSWPGLVQIQFPVKPRGQTRPFPKGSCTTQLKKAMQASKPHIPVGERLKYFLAEWYKLTSDPAIIDTVRGMHINLNNIPHQKSPPYPLRMSPEETEATNSQIQTLLNKKAIVLTWKGEPGKFISTVFLQPKKDKGYHMILNLKRFNKHVHYNHFKMETLYHILSLVTPHCFMAIFDLQDAYLVISIAGIHVKFLKFEWQGKVYMYIVKPFRLAEAPRKFTKLLKPILSKICRMGIVIAIYIDDGWVKGNTYKQCLNNVLYTVKLFAKLGFLLHHEKSTPIPSQQVSILGFDIDSITMLITLGDDKTNKAIDLGREALNRNTVSIWFLAKIIGTLISLLPACPWGPAHYRSLETVKLEALIHNKWNWKANCQIFGECITDLQWWIRTLPTTAAPISCNMPNKVISSDASDEGWGSYYKGMVAQGKFDPEQRDWHINTKEVVAAYYGIKSFMPYLPKDHLLLRCDNTTAISDLRDMGTLISPIRDRFSRKLWQLMYEKDCWMSINYIKSQENWNTDLASRVFNKQTEWVLPQEVFLQVVLKFDCPTINLFASCLNKKLNRYISWIPDPYCLDVDAFYYDWSQEFPYLYHLLIFWAGA